MLVERQRLDRRHQFLGELLVAALLARRERVVLELVLDVLVLQAAELLVEIGDLVEGFDDRRLQLGFHGGERNRVLEIVVVLFLLRDAGALAGDLVFLVVAIAGLGGERRRGGLAGGAAVGRLAGLRDRRRAAVGTGRAMHLDRRVLGFGAGIGGLEVDDVAQQNLALVELAAPDDDRLEGQRGFAEARDHGLAAGLDALGDGDFALARQQLDRTHLAQIHAHRIVGAVGRLLGGLGGDGGGRALGDLGSLLLLLFLRVVGLFHLVGLDDVDAHLVEHRHDVLDLLGRGGVRGENLVELVDGHIAALFRGLDHLLDAGIGKVEQRPVGGLRRGFRRLFVFLHLGGHALLRTGQKRRPASGVRPKPLKTFPNPSRRALFPAGRRGAEPNYTVLSHA